MKSLTFFAMCFLVSTTAWSQAPTAGAHVSVQAPADPGEAAVLATCKNPPAQRPVAAGGGQRPGAAAPPAREYMVEAIPGVIAAGQKWTFLWEQMGNNGDGILGTSDGGLLIAQNDSSDVLKLDKNGKTSVAYTGTNTGGALSMNSKGELFVAERGLNPSITELAPTHKTLADKYHGDPLDCIGTVLNDVSADSHGGVYFTMGGLYYANSSGTVTSYGQNLRTNGIILSPNEKKLYVTNGTTLASFDVQPDGSLTNQQEFAKLEQQFPNSSGAVSGDGSTVDSQGRLYVTTPPGVQVISPDGKYLGLIPTPRPVISVAFSGPDKKRLFILARGAKDPQGNEVANAAQVYSIEMIAQGYKKRAK